MYKQIIEGKKAVFFDLDGTIVYTNYLWEWAIGEVLKGIGGDWISSEYIFVPGQALSEQWEKLIKTFKLTTEKNIETLVSETNKKFLEVLEKSNLSLQEGFSAFLYEIKTEKELKTVLVTNSIKEVALPVLQKINAENSFDLIIYGDEVKKPKPDPEIYNKALSMLSLKPEEALVFEDSTTGAEAANKANLEMVIIWDGKYPESTYSGKVFLFTPDFSPLPGNLDISYKDWLLENAKKFAEKDKKINETKASDLGANISGN